jgi:ubiquinone/menaquinone biosynthesis C-methylase UbiE
MAINTKKTDLDWEFFGKNDPYYGVYSCEEFRQGNLTNENIEKFFKSGQDHIELVLKIVRHHLDPKFKPRKAIDFGCGVGRLVLPLSLVCDSVVGVDISESMLEEARKNYEERGISNISLVKSDETLSQVSGKYDFVHSFIVLQHIPVKKGENLVKRMIEILDENGIGALHFTYFNQLPKLQKTRNLLYQTLPLLEKLKSLIKGKDYEPVMQLNQYNLNNIFHFLQKNNCHRSFVCFTGNESETGVDGILICFQKSTNPMIYPNVLAEASPSPL